MTDRDRDGPDLSRRYFVSIFARRHDGHGWHWRHSLGAVDECDSEDDAFAWAHDHADETYPKSDGWEHGVNVAKADRSFAEESDHDAD